MPIKAYLLEAFAFNDQANRSMIRKIGTLPKKEEAVRYLSHLINSQNKWLARIRQDPNTRTMSWWEPVYAMDDLEGEWQKSLAHWVDYLNQTTEDALNREVTFTGFDGARWAATPKDIALQLNYHSVHHRAQIQVLIRQQGIEPDFIDYIGTKYRRLNPES